LQFWVFHNLLDKPENSLFHHIAFGGVLSR
jgi:hypothetical protein